MTFIPLDEVVWRSVKFLEKPDETFEYEFELPEPLASWDVFANWERERFHSMSYLLRQGDVLFDVGTEQGWTNLIYAQFVGPANMVLIEPTPEFWGNIQATWAKNYGDEVPLECYDGLFSDRTTDRRTQFYVWPDCADGPLIDRQKYQYIHANDHNIPEMRMDDFVQRTGTVPSAITMDVEGAELLVLKGAQETLREHRPRVWVSVHPDLMARDYDCTPDQVHDFMASLGYKAEHLATDHEQHFCYHP